MEFDGKEGFAQARRRDLRRHAAAIALALGLAAWAIGASAREEAEPRIDLNRASVQELMSLPGVGAAKAQAIVDHRRTAPFKKIEELLLVKGIGDAIYAGLRERITVSGEDTTGATREAGARSSAPDARD